MNARYIELIDSRSFDFRIENAINDIYGKIDFADHHVEHELASVNDHILNMLGKIEKREDKSESRIDNIEDVSILTVLMFS